MGNKISEYVEEVQKIIAGDPQSQTLQMTITLDGSHEKVWRMVKLAGEANGVPIDKLQTSIFLAGLKSMGVDTHSLLK